MIDIEQVVVHGRKIGRALGFPTANMSLEGYKDIAMSNVGIRPSVGGKELLLETHVIGFSGDLYGRRLRITLEDKLRDEKRFSSISDLKEQLQRDYAICAGK